MHKHENDLEQSIKTKRLAALLASQLELQQHLLHQQRNGTNCSKNNPRQGSNKKLKCFEPERSAGSCDRPACEVSGCEKKEPTIIENKNQEQQAFHKPTILISAINSCERTENTNTSEQSIVVPVSVGSPFTSSDSVLSERKSRDDGGEQSSSGQSSIKPANQDAIEENCDRANYSQYGRQPRLTITSSSSSSSAVATTATTRNKPSRDDVLLAENQIKNYDGSLNENSNSDSYLDESKSQIENQNEMMRAHHHHAAAQKHKSLETGKLGGQQVVRQQYRHSYCAPGELLNTKNEHSGSLSKESQLNVKQTSELSTQAKIINILFTRSESKVEQVVGSDDRMSHQKSGKQMLMPSLLRQYQRRLSNFHQQGNHSNTCQSNPSSCRISSDQDSSRTIIDEELKESSVRADHKQVISCARAAASLATAAASAAQAIVSQQARSNALARSRARCDQSAQTNSEREEIFCLSKSRSGLSLLVGSQVNLYSLTEEYKSKLNSEHYQHLSIDNERISSGLGSKQRIQHFCVNFMNNMHLYEINIVDMPPIEPVSFPTSSLLEWSLFKGQSHLLTADAYLLVFDLTRPSTIQYIKSLRDKIFESREMSNIPAYVIANKADLCPTLQLSLQARRMRNVAARRNQASVNSQSGQPNTNTASPGATATSATATPAASIGTKPNLLYSQPAFSHSPSTGRFLSSWTRLGRERRPTLDLGAQYSRAMPTKAAHQLLTTYKEHRMRLGSSGPIISLRRWARLRRAIVRSNETNNVCSSAQWLQFERTRAQCKLAFGASNTTESGSPNQWVSNVGKALARFKTHVNDKYCHLNRSGTNNDGRRRHKTKADIYLRSQRKELDMFGKRKGAACCGKRGCQQKRKKKLRAERKRRTATKKLHDEASEGDFKKDRTSIGRFVTISRWFNNDQAAGMESRQQQTSEQSSRSDRIRVSFPGCPVDDSVTDKRESFAIKTSSSNLISGLKVFKASSERAKRKRQDKSDSTGVKSSSLRSKSGLKRKQRVDGSFQQYSKLLTTAAKRNSLAENELNNTKTSNFYQSSTSREWSPIGASNYAVTNSTNTLAATSNSGKSQPAGEPMKSSGQIKPVSGFLGTTSSRQAFYELFNKLLQTSSTTVAKTQLTLSSVHGDDESQDDSCDKSRVGLQGQHVCRNEQREIVKPSKVELLTISCVDGQKEEKRRKSSTGAALWQTLSSLALNRSSRVSSVCSNSSEATKRQLDQAASTLAQTAKAEVDQQNVRRTEGVKLGTDQYLSIDMLRKLSLISSSSQMSVGGGTTVCVGNEQSEPKSGSDINPEHLRPNSAPTHATNLNNKLSRDGRASTDSSSSNFGRKDNICANNGQHASSRAKRIWYRGVMKKILFQSNKRSLKSIVTAARLQKHINDMDEAEQIEESVSRLNEDSSCLAMKNNLINDQSESGVMETTIRVPTTVVTAETFDGPAMEESKEILGAKQAPSIRIITSGSSLSLISSGNEDCRSVSNENNIRKAASESSLDEGGIQREAGSALAEDQIKLDSCQTSSRGWAKNQAELISDEPRVCEITSSERGEQPGEGVSSVAGSLSSLSESVSLSAEIKQQTAQSCFYSSIEPRTRRAQSASAGKATSASTHLDSITETIDLNQAQSSETLNGQSSVSRNLSELQQPEIEDISGVRKLSADDCLIFNRQRRKSKALAEGSEDNEENWLFVGQSNKHSNSAEPSVPSSLNRSKMFNNTYREGEVGTKQRNNNRNSIEMAAELLVPRVKGTRSASITLGVNESQHKSLSQLGNTILGAMNVQRTWRHFLAKKKSGGSELVNNPNKVTEPTQASQYKNKESNVDFLNSNKAFTRLSLGQQREAAINFNQLMRINQLTLSAANLVMISNGRDGTGKEPVKQNATVSSEAKQQQQQQQQQAVGAARDNNTAVTAASSPERRENRCNTSSKESMRSNRRTSARQPQALMTRLQTGGNLLLGRNSTRRELKSVGDCLESCSFAYLGRSNIALSTAKAIGGVEKASQYHDERVLRSANSLVCLTPSVGVGNTAKFDMPEAKGGDVKQVNETSSGQVLSFEPEERSGLLQDGSNMSAEIANAAASALERQKRRGEELSLILEPRYDKKQAGAKYPLFVNNDLNPILKDLAQLVRKHWKCNYIECSAASNWNIKPIISELTRALECNRQTARRRARLDKQEYANEPNLFTSDDDSCNESQLRRSYDRHLNGRDNYEYEDDEEEDDGSDYEDEYESEDDGNGENGEGEEEMEEDCEGLRKCSYCKGTNDSWWRSRRSKGQSRCLVKNRTNNHRKSETMRPNTLETIFQVATNKREKERRPLGGARLMTRRTLDPPTKSGFFGTTNTRGRSIEMKHSSDCKTLPEEEEEEDEEVEGTEIKSSSLAGPDKHKFLEHQAGYGRSLGQKGEFKTKSSEVSSERPKGPPTSIHSSFITKRKRKGSKSKLESQNGTNCAIM